MCLLCNFASSIYVEAITNVTRSFLLNRQDKLWKGTEAPAIFVRVALYTSHSIHVSYASENVNEQTLINIALTVAFPTSLQYQKSHRLFVSPDSVRIDFARFWGHCGYRCLASGLQNHVLSLRCHGVMGILACEFAHCSQTQNTC